MHLNLNDLAGEWPGYDKEYDEWARRRPAMKPITFGGKDYYVVGMFVVEPAKRMWPFVDKTEQEGEE